MCPPLRLGARRRSTYNRIETNVLHLSNHQDTQSCKKRKKHVQKGLENQEEDGKSKWLKKQKLRGRRRMKVGRHHRQDGRYAHGAAATFLPTQRDRTGLA